MLKISFCIAPVMDKQYLSRIKLIKIKINFTHEKRIYFSLSVTLIFAARNCNNYCNS